MILMTSTTVPLQREPEVGTGHVDTVSNVQDDTAVLVQVKNTFPPQLSGPAVITFHPRVKYGAASHSWIHPGAVN